jgi:mRNA interferase RelE/StbE
MYSIVYSKQAKKFIQALSKQRRLQLKVVFEQLMQNPFVFPYTKIKGKDLEYRIRVGKFRILYSVHKKELLIEVVKVGKRENFYS